MNNLAVLRDESRTLNIGCMNYDPMLQLLSSQNKTVSLRCKINKLLHCLANNPKVLVSRDELIRTIWGGNYYIGEKALTHTVCKLRQIFISLGDERIRIITVPKAGYCLI